MDVYEEPRDDATVVGSILDPDEELQGWQPFHFRSSNNTVTELGIVEVGYEEKAVVIYIPGVNIQIHQPGEVCQGAVSRWRYW